MNTILTDDEIDELPLSAATVKDGRADSRTVEAAVLAKLREQEPVAWWVTLPSGEIDWSDEPIQHKEERPLDTLIPGCGYQPLYAAPLPAVVQVPQGWKLVPVEPTEAMLDRGHHQIDFDRSGQRTDVLVDPSHADKLGSGTTIEQDMRDCWAAMLAAAPEAPAQGEQAVEPVRDERAAFDAKWPTPENCIWTGCGYAAMSFPSRADEHVKRWEGWQARAALASTERQPPVPAPWREAVKVAREALQMLQDGSTQMENGIWGSIRMPSDAAMNAGKAALAQLDALEDGE